MSTGHPLPPPRPADLAKPRSSRSNWGLGVSGLTYWKRLGWKISLISAHGSTLMSLAFLPLSLWFMGSMGGGIGPGFFGMMLAMMVISIPLGWVASFLWSALLSLLVLPAVYLGQRLIGETIRRDSTGWIAGSAIAVIGSAGGLLQIGSIRASAAAIPAGVFWMLAIQLLGGLMGIAAAQMGGYLGSLSALRRRRRQNASDKPLRFTVWRLMAITAILSVVLSLLTFTGEFAVPLLISLMVSSLLAWAIHRPVAWATNRWLDWRLKKRRKKRAARRINPSANLAAAPS